ncbi:hypothetical protein NDU88_004348 [Pleurodeles waltl]|uniref:Uncharacterized protein n=1 Tax=Pleurodeles waltl TaxID=8319 RepID=A0AAV7QCB3_PLEWA|nr:hypothetical protein NDU88_004348 [Pleurodeles waltl]
MRPGPRPASGTCLGGFGPPAPRRACGLPRHGDPGPQVGPRAAVGRASRASAAGPGWRGGPGWWNPGAGGREQGIPSGKRQRRDWATPGLRWSGVNRRCPEEGARGRPLARRGTGTPRTVPEERGDGAKRRGPPNETLPRGQEKLKKKKKKKK